MIRHAAALALFTGLSVTALSAQTADPSLERDAQCSPRAGIGPGPAAAPRVLGMQDTVARNLFGLGDLLVIGMGTDGGMQIGQQYYIRRSDVLGARDNIGLHSINTLGWVSIVAANETTAIAQVTFACNGIEVGDYLEPYVEPALPANILRVDTTGELDFSAPRHLLFGEDNHYTVGTGKFMVSDVPDDVAPGTRYAIFRDVHQAGVPLAYVGEAVVVFPGGQASIVRLTAARDAVQTGDLLIPRKP